jgi:hypothetical protein
VADEEIYMLLDLFQRFGDRAVIEAILQSAPFIYRFEVGERAKDGGYILDQYELASEVSYMIINSSPDDELWQSATMGLKDIDKQVERLINSDRGKAHLTDVLLKWSGVKEVLDRTKADPSFPVNKYKYLDQTSVLFHQILWGDRPRYRRLLDFLEHPSHMASVSKFANSSIVHRGLFIVERLMCVTIPPPPLDISISRLENMEKFNQYAFAKIRSETPRCQGCHQFIDPAGGLFEKYDAVGKLRKPRYMPWLPEVKLPGVSTKISTIEDLKDEIGRSDKARRCFADSIFAHQFGLTPQEVQEKKFAEGLHKSFIEHGDVKRYIVALTKSKTFRYRSE